MADVKVAIDYMLGWEDSTLSGVITTNQNGLKTRFGIDQTFHPELNNCLFFTTMGQIAALAVARNVYEKSYAAPLCIAEMPNQDIANKVLSLGVNVGVTEAAKMLQEALLVPGDGRIGTLTLGALDRADPEITLSRLRAEAELYYDELIERNPALQVYRAGWLRRAAAI